MATKLTEHRYCPVRFPLGRLLATPAAMMALGAAGVVPSQLLNRHVCGDWGEVSPADAAANERGLKDDERLFSVYQIGEELRIWVITEWDRSVTTILLPEEY